jgi:hypothetical protein
MRWILDACTLIYLVKSNLFDLFYSLAKFPICIDTSVFDESVIQGKKHNHQDAITVEKALMKFKIPVIPVEIQEYISIFRDPGETSLYILANDDGVGVTSDRRAYNKFLEHNINVLKLEQFFFQKYIDKLLTKKDLIDILAKLEEIWALSSKEHLNILSNITELEE